MTSPSATGPSLKSTDFKTLDLPRTHREGAPVAAIERRPALYR
jgi:hypothetical protein